LEFVLGINLLLTSMGLKSHQSLLIKVQKTLTSVRKLSKRLFHF